MNLTLRDIEYFVAVVEHRGLARAAAVLGVSQPALSKSLKRLEDDTGLTLLHRNCRPVQPTSAGLVFLEHARRLRTEYADALRHASDMRAGEAGLLRVGATGATLDTVVLPALAHLLPRRPAMRVQILPALSDQLVHLIEDGELDLAVLPTYGELGVGVDSVRLAEDELHLVASTQHPLSGRLAIPLADLLQQRWVLPKASSDARRMIDRCFAEAGLALPTPLLEVDSVTHGVLELLQTLDAVAAVPQTVLQHPAAPRLATLRVSRIRRLYRHLSLISRARTIWSPLMLELRDALVVRQTVAT